MKTLRTTLYYFLYFCPPSLCNFSFYSSLLHPPLLFLHLGDRETPLSQETKKFFAQSFLLNSTHVPFVRTLSSFYQQFITIVWELQVFVAYIRNDVRASEAFVKSRGKCGYSWDSIRHTRKGMGETHLFPLPSVVISAIFYYGKSTNIFQLL